MAVNLQQELKATKAKLTTAEAKIKELTVELEKAGECTWPECEEEAEYCEEHAVSFIKPTLDILRAKIKELERENTQAKEALRWRGTQEEPPPKDNGPILALFAFKPVVVFWHTWPVGGENIPRADGGDDGSPEDGWESGWVVLGDSLTGFVGEPESWMPIPGRQALQTKPESTAGVCALCGDSWIGHHVCSGVTEPDTKEDDDE